MPFGLETNALLFLTLLECGTFFLLLLSQTLLFFVDATGARHMVLRLRQQILALIRFDAGQLDVVARLIPMHRQIGKVSVFEFEKMERKKMVENRAIFGRIDANFSYL